jgi:hypothetical protein
LPGARGRFSRFSSRRMNPSITGSGLHFSHYQGSTSITNHPGCAKFLRSGGGSGIRRRLLYRAGSLAQGSRSRSK